MRLWGWTVVLGATLATGGLSRLPAQEPNRTRPEPADSARSRLERLRELLLTQVGRDSVSVRRPVVLECPMPVARVSGGAALNPLLRRDYRP
jgi:hypothetical protein